MATAAEIQSLTKEIQKLKDERKTETEELTRLREEFRELRTDPNRENTGQGGLGQAAGYRMKDLSAANFIKVWKGEPFGIPVGEFLSTFRDFAEAGSWSEDDKKRILRVKLEGSAKRFLNSRADLKFPETSFEEIANAIEDRFKNKQPDQYHYSMFQTAVQHKGEDPNDFLDRLRVLGEMTETKTDDPAKQEIIRSELQKRLLAVFTNGLLGIVGEQVRFRLPKTIDEALQIAVTVHTEEKKKYASSHEKRSVFATSSVCFNCNKPGHRAKECRFNRNFMGSQGRENYQNNGASNSSNGIGRGKLVPFDRFRASAGYPRNSTSGMRLGNIQCYRCRKMGHMANQCKEQGNPRGSTGNPQLSNQRGQ